MRVGSIGYSTQQGLGILLKAFYDNGVVTDVCTVHHWKHVNYYWYGSKHVINPRDRNRAFETAKEFAKEMDVMMFFETPFVLQILPWCKDQGIPTVLMPMYECTPQLPCQPDLILNPSQLDQLHYPQGEYLPVPVSISNPKVRSKAKKFIHNAGHGGIYGRNGTRELIEALRYVKSSAQFIIRSQEERFTVNHHPNTLVTYGDYPYENLFSDGDVFIFPEKFNGLSLPLQEAYASGMLVMATDRFPNNTWLPTDPLIPISGVANRRVISNIFQEAVLSPEIIAEQIDRWYGADIEKYSIMGLEYGTANSWEILGPKYKERITKLWRSPLTK